MKLQPAAFNPAHIQNIVDNGQQMSGGLAHLVQAIDHMRRIVGVRQRNIRHADDGVHRSANVMAHVGEKTAFGGIGFFRTRDGVLQFLSRGIQHLPERFRRHIITADGQEPKLFFQRDQAKGQFGVRFPQKQVPAVHTGLFHGFFQSGKKAGRHRIETHCDRGRNYPALGELQAFFVGITDPDFPGFLIQHKAGGSAPGVSLCKGLILHAFASFRRCNAATDKFRAVSAKFSTIYYKERLPLRQAEPPKRKQEKRHSNAARWNNAW